MKPRTPQAPRPPIVIGALGPVMQRLTARVADTWNTMSFAKTFEEQLAEVRDKVRIIDEACTKAGRDPASLRRSYLMFDPQARASSGAMSYYQSVGAFEEMAGRVMEALIFALEKGLGDDFTPEVRDAWVATYTTVQSVMTKVAAEVKPAKKGFFARMSGT